MRAKLLAGVTIGLIYLVSSAAMAQTTPAEPVTPPDPAAPATQAAPADAPAVAPVEAPPVASAPAPAVVPKGTPIIVSFTDLLSTRTSKNDDMFNLKLAEPVMLNGMVVIPAGTPGKGIVIDSAPPGMGGKPGKLVLAARYLDFQGKQIPIKALDMSKGGRDNSDESLLMSMAFGVFGLMVKGGDMEVQPGMRAGAKLGADFVVDTSAAAVTPPQDAPVDPAAVTLTPAADPAPATPPAAADPAPATPTAAVDPTPATQNPQ